MCLVLIAHGERKGGGERDRQSGREIMGWTEEEGEGSFLSVKMVGFY